MKATLRERSFQFLETIFIVLVSFLTLLILIILRQRLDIKAENLIEPSWLVVVLLPLLVWLVASGRLTEFSAGAVTAKLAQIAAEPVATAVDLASIGSNLISEMALSAPDEQLATAISASPIILKLRVGLTGYSDEGIKRWITRLLEVRLRYVAFVDNDDRLQKYISANAVLAYLNRGGSLHENLEKWYIPNIPGLRGDRLQIEIANRHAIEYLTRNRRDDVAVIDEQGRLVGLLRLADVIVQYLPYLGPDKLAPLPKTTKD